MHHARRSRTRIRRVAVPFAAVLVILAAVPLGRPRRQPRRPRRRRPPAMTMDARALRPGPRSDRLLDGDPRRPRQRRPGVHRRAAPRRRHPGTNALRRPGGPPDDVAQGLHPARPGAGVRQLARGRARRRRERGRPAGPSPSRSTIPGSSWSASSPSGRDRSSPRWGGCATRPAPCRRSSQLTVADLPERPEAWSALDRLVWQDVDAGQLSAEQLAALRTWLAGGGRLTIVGGTGGLGLLAGFPDELLPFRPTVTVDVDPEAIRGLARRHPAPRRGGAARARRDPRPPGARALATERRPGDRAPTGPSAAGP